MLFVLQPDRLRDEEITELEEYLQSLILHQNINNNLPAKDCASLNSPSLPSQGSSPSPQVTFLFQGQQFGEWLGLSQRALSFPCLKAKREDECSCWGLPQVNQGSAAPCKEGGRIVLRYCHTPQPFSSWGDSEPDVSEAVSLSSLLTF